MSKVVDVVVDSTMVVDNQKCAGIGGRMKAAREALGLSQDAMAKAVGGSKRGIQENETRNRVPGGEVVAGMVMLGINANWLLTGEGPMLLADLVASAPVGINVDALVQAISAIFTVAPKGDSVDTLARKAVAFYQYCESQGLITPEGQGTGVLKNSA